MVSEYDPGVRIYQPFSSDHFGVINEVPRVSQYESGVIKNSPMVLSFNSFIHSKDLSAKNCIDTRVDGFFIRKKIFT